MRKVALFGIILSMGMLSTLPIAHALDLTVETDDGLFLRFGNRGEIVEMNSGDLKLDSNDWYDQSGFFIRDITSGNELALRGKLDRINDAVHLFDATAEGYTVDATIKSMGQYIEVSGTVSQEDPEDHAAVLSFRLPVRATNGLWWEDLDRKYEINESTTYDHVIAPYQIGQDVPGTDNRDAINMGVYPFTSASVNGVGLSLAVPMDKPAMVRPSFQYQKGYFIEYDFGFAEETNSKNGVSPNSASFTFYIYQHDPRYGLRAAAKKYYELFPKFFETKVDQDRMGILIDDQDNITRDEMSQYGIGLIKTPITANVSTALEKGAYRLATGECFNLWIPSEDVPREAETNAEFFTEAEVRNMLWEERGSTRALPHLGNKPIGDIIEQAMVAMPYTSQSELLVKLGRSPFKVMETYGEEVLTHLAVDCAPQLQGKNIGTTMYELFFAKAAPGGSEDKKWDGVYIDQLTLGSYQGGDPVNFRRDHFAHTKYPLIFEPNSGVPVTLLTYGNIDWVKNIANIFHKGNKIVMGDMNVVLSQPTMWWYAPYLDILGGKVGYLDVRNDSDIDFKTYAGILRLLSGKKKPIYATYTAEDGRDFKEFLELALAYGIYPSTTLLEEDEFIDSPQLAEWKEYTPLLKTLNDAGWEPENYVSRIQRDQFVVERFGTPEKNNIVYTIHNETDVRRKVELGLNLHDMGVETVELITDLRKNKEYTPDVVASTLFFEEEIQPKTTMLLALSVIPEKKAVGELQPETDMERVVDNEQEISEGGTESDTIQVDANDWDTYTDSKTKLGFEYPRAWGTPVQEPLSLSEGNGIKITFSSNQDVWIIANTSDAVGENLVLYQGDQKASQFCAILTAMSEVSCRTISGKVEDIAGFVSQGLFDTDVVTYSAFLQEKEGAYPGIQAHVRLPHIKLTSSSVKDAVIRLDNGTYYGNEEEQITNFTQMISSLRMMDTAVFTDVDNTTPSSQAIFTLYERGIIKGYDDGTFRPDQVVNRAEMLKFIMETLELETIAPTEPCFTDVPAGEWYSKYVCTAKLQGWIEGYPDEANPGQRKFVPWQEVQRVEAIKMLGEMQHWNLLTHTNEPLFAGEGYEEWTKDFWYQPYIKYAKGAGLIDGDSNGTYLPWASMTRGSMAEMVARIIK